MDLIHHIGVFTSGGDSPGMNAAIRAVVRTALYNQIKISGIRFGYQGLINNDIIEMDHKSVANIIQRGGTILKTARCEAFKTDEGMQKAYENCVQHGIDALVCIGGDGSFRGANAFSKKFNIPVIGIPGTIDNDMYGTDNTIGYDTALNTVVEAVDKIRDTASSHSRLFFIEVMGRDAGFIALRSGIIMVAEGDDAGGAFEVANKVKEKFSEYSTRVSVLGHLQRGGSPSCADRVLASRLGQAAVEALIHKKSNIMVGIVNREVKYTKLEKAVKHHNSINKDLLETARILSL
jgi:6-phosphofructokinase 1